MKRGFDAIASQGRLGAVLAQFPISFKYTEENRAHVDDLVRRFSEYPLVVEVRHLSWNKPEVLNWLASAGWDCAISISRCWGRQSVRARATSAVGYVRLHGGNHKNWFAESNVRERYDYLYSESELDHWKERVEEVAEQAATTFVVANNHNLGKAAVNALELINMLQGIRVRVPPPLLARYPNELTGIAAEQRQQRGLIPEASPEPRRDASGKK